MVYQLPSSRSEDVVIVSSSDVAMEGVGVSKFARYLGGEIHGMCQLYIG